MEFKKGDYVVEIGRWGSTTYFVVSISKTGKITGSLPSGATVVVGKPERFLATPTVRVATIAEVAAFRAAEERERVRAAQRASDLTAARAGLASTDFSTLPEYLVLDMWQQVKKSQK